MEAIMDTLLTRLDIDPATFALPEPPEIGNIREVLLAGNKIKAIKLYREYYGVSLKESKNAIDAIEKNLRR